MESSKSLCRMRMSALTVLLYRTVIVVCTVWCSAQHFTFHVYLDESKNAEQYKNVSFSDVMLRFFFLYHFYCVRECSFMRDQKWDCKMLKFACEPKSETGGWYETKLPKHILALMWKYGKIVCLYLRFYLQYLNSSKYEKNKKMNKK